MRSSNSEFEVTSNSKLELRIRRSTFEFDSRQLILRPKTGCKHPSRFTYLDEEGGRRRGGKRLGHFRQKSPQFPPVRNLPAVPPSLKPPCCSPLSKISAEVHLHRRMKTSTNNCQEHRTNHGWETNGESQKMSTKEHVYGTSQNIRKISQSIHKYPKTSKNT